MRQLKDFIWYGGDYNPDQWPEEIWEEDMDNWEMDENILDEEFTPILEDHVSTILEVLNNRTWTGRIIATDNNTIRINGGEDIGITKDHVFEVFGKGESIRSVSGKDYYFRGPKVGEIKPHNVMEDYSTAIPLTGEQFQIGQLIRLKN